MKKRTNPQYKNQSPPFLQKIRLLKKLPTDNLLFFHSKPKTFIKKEPNRNTDNNNIREEKQQHI